MNRSKNIIKFIASGICSKIVMIIVSLLQIRILSASLGLEYLGLWALTTSVFSVSNFLDFGVSLGMQNRLSKAITTGNVIEQAFIISNGVLVMLAACFIAILAFLIISITNSWFIFYGQNLDLKSDIIQVSSGIALCVILLNLIGAPAARLAAAGDANWVPPVLQSVLSLIGLLATSIAIHLGAGYSCVLIISLAPFILLPIVIVVVFARSIKIDLSRIDFSLTSSLLKDGFWLAVPQITFPILFQYPQIVIAKTHGLTEVGRLAIILRYCTAAGSMMWTIFVSFWPAYAKAKVDGDAAWVGRQYSMNILIALAVGITAGLITLNFGELAISIIAKTGGAYSPSVYWVISLWMLAYSIWCSIAAYLNGTDKYIMSALAAIMMVLSLILTINIFTSRWGVLGVVISLTLSTTLVSLIFGLVGWRKRYIL